MNFLGKHNLKYLRVHYSYSFLIILENTWNVKIYKPTTSKIIQSIKLEKLHNFFIDSILILSLGKLNTVFPSVSSFPYRIPRVCNIFQMGNLFVMLWTVDLIFFHKYYMVHNHWKRERWRNTKAVKWRGKGERYRSCCWLWLRQNTFRYVNLVLYLLDGKRCVSITWCSTVPDIFHFVLHFKYFSLMILIKIK